MGSYNNNASDWIDLKNALCQGYSTDSKLFNISYWVPVTNPQSNHSFVIILSYLKLVLTTSLQSRIFCMFAV